MINKLFTQPHIRQGTQQEIGTGLGLQISSELLSKQNGKLFVENIPEKGITVKVFLAKPLPNDLTSKSTVEITK